MGRQARGRRWLGRRPPGRRPLGRRALGRGDLLADVGWGDAAVAQDPRHRAARLPERGKEQMLGRELDARFPGILGRGLDQPPGVRSVSQLLPAPPRPAPPSAGFEPGPDLIGLESESPKHRLAGGAGTKQRQHDVLRADRIVPQPLRLVARLRQRLLGAFAQCVRLDAGCGFGAQSGLASSMSMIGMPSSTA